GIGLWLVRNLIAMHGGSVQASSAGPEKGSEFTIRLPLAQNESPDPRSKRPLPDLACRRRILVVDDHEDAARSIAALLKMAGNEIAIASDGPSALRIAAAQRFDIVLLDIGLPGMDGYELVRR